MKVHSSEAHTLEYKLHRGHGPLMVFENGLGTSMANTWGNIIPALDPIQATFTYNRPGYGASPMTTRPRDGTHIVADLRALLHRLDLAPPYLLVGHSMGGLYMQLFARRHPDEVAALVLIDPTHPLQFEGFGAIEQRPWWFRLLFGLFLRVYGGKAELAAANETGRQVLATPLQGDFPVFVLHSGSSRNHNGNPAATSALNRYSIDRKKDFLNLYPGCQLDWIDSGHHISKECPDVVRATLQAALSAAHDIIKTRSGGPAAQQDPT